MPYPETQCFLIQPIGQRQSVGVMWDGQCGASPLHLASRFVSEVRPVGELGMPDILAPDWSGVTCERCGAPGDGHDLRRHGGLPTIFDTEDGTWNHPGAMWWSSEHPGLPGHPRECFYWDNCSGRHLHVVLPNGHPWDIDSRANNCTRRDDRTHRCWVREGEPPLVTAGKAGDTCAAGAGSILAGDYHGFLRDGVLTAG